MTDLNASDPSSHELPESNELEALVALGAALAVADPVPRGIVAFASAIPSWARLDGELAELLADSGRDQELAGVRSSAGIAQRVMVFETDAFTIEVLATAGRTGDTTLNIDGQLAPSGPATVELHRAAGFDSAPADELGRFRFDGVTQGLIALVISTEAAVVHTPWFRP